MNTPSHDPDETNGDSTILRRISSERVKISEDRLTQVLIDGKTVFVSKDAPPVTPRLKQRSLRGEGSLIETMNNRLNASEELIKELVSIGLIRGLEVHKSLERLKTIAEHVDETIPALTDIESEIDRKHASVPNYRDRSLIQQALELRYALLWNKYQLYSIQYDLLSRHLSWAVSHTIEKLNSLTGDDRDYQEYIPTIESLANILELKPIEPDNSLPLKTRILNLESEIDRLSDTIDNRIMKAKSYLDKIDTLLSGKTTIN